MVCFFAFLAARFSLIDFCAAFLFCFSPLSLACATVRPPSGSADLAIISPGAYTRGVIGLIVIGAILAFAAIVSFLSRRRPNTPDTRWDDPGQAEAHAAQMLSRLGRSGASNT